MTRIFAPVALMAVALSGCSMAKQAAGAVEGVAQFHQMLNAGQYAAIWTGGAPALQSATPEAKFVTLMTAYHDKMGAFQSMVKSGAAMQDNAQGDYVTLNFNVTYAKATATEKFVFQSVNGQQLLEGFSTHNIQTNAS